MIITNGLVYTEDCQFSLMDIAFEDGIITRVAPVGSLSAKDAIDAAGGFVLPGFVDIHLHGAKGMDFSDAEPFGLETLLEYCGGEGITSVVPATMSLDETRLAEVIKTALPYFQKSGYGAVLRGMHLEGPFLNPQKKGAQNPEYIQTPDPDLFERLYALSGGNIRMLDIAPELPGSLDVIRKATTRCAVSLAHTAASYDEAAKAFEAGAGHVSHLFNAMPPFLHRDPGVVGAASDFAAHVDIIADGVHLHPSVVRAVFKWFGPARVCLVSDSMRAAGMPDGEYTLGGQNVHVHEGCSTLPDGSLAGSAVTLAECCRRAVKFGVPMEHAVRAATINPAKAVGIDREVGSLMPGKRADILIWNRELQPLRVIVGGETIFD